MVRYFLDIMLGNWGRTVLMFYKTNAMPINIVVVAYGLVLALSWNNLKRIRAWLISEIIDQVQSSPDIGPDMKPVKVLRGVEIPWEIATEGRFPLVAKQLDLWPRKTSTTVLQSLLPPEELVAKALESIAK